MNERVRAIVFMGVLGGVSALLLTGARRVLPHAMPVGVEQAEARSVLRALGVEIRPGSPSKDVSTAFAGHVRTERRGAMRLYFLKPRQSGERGRVVAIPFIGRGHRGLIHGVLAIETDGRQPRRIRRVVIYRHDETPGLGGQIATPEFQDRLAGATIDPSAAAPLRIVAGARRANEVDAITGATMTCRALERILNRVIRDFTREQDRNGER